MSLTGPVCGERRYRIKSFNGDEGMALDVARSVAITLACQKDGPADGDWYIRDEFDSVYCSVEKRGKTVTVNMR